MDALHQAVIGGTDFFLGSACAQLQNFKRLLDAHLTGCGTALVLLFFLLPLSLAGAGVLLPLLLSPAGRLRGPPETQKEGLPEADALPPAGGI
jgi:hypothetical protein